MTAPKFVMTRAFDAPRDLVWRCWTDKKLIGRWYGAGVDTEVHKLDVTPGGLWLHEMKMRDMSMYQRMEYLEVSPPEKLVMLMSNADADWNAIPSPMVQNWPKTLLTTVTLTESDGKTELVLEWEPHEASDEEIGAFAQALDKLDQGWGKGMDMIARILGELQ